MTSMVQVELQKLRDLQRVLEERTSDLEASANEVLALGRAVLDFAEREEAALFPLLPLLDPAARAELGGEHEQLREDLELLDYLARTSPESPDASTLAEAITRRMRSHIARDGRLLAQAERMAGR